jgi:putative CocE/NonD family hydrolase
MRAFRELILLALAAFALQAQEIAHRDVSVPMRDGVILRADILLPQGNGPFPVLVYRTPYGKHRAIPGYSIFKKAIERGYAVVVQDVRGRYASDGEYGAYAQEGRDGYDTIEWAAAQSWSNGAVGTFGLSYPGAVQWLAAVENPPHLKAMVPAMTFASPRIFFYGGGVWDNSWSLWIWYNIAPDLRRRKDIPGPKTGDEAEREWPNVADRIRFHLPLLDLPDFKMLTPWYYEWMRHESTDAWWDWAELRDKYARTSAAVLNISGWHDEAYGPHGATTNFAGLAAARTGQPLRAKLIMGPWAHGIGGMSRETVGEREVGADSNIDYDETVLRWLDHHVRGVANGVDRESPVRIFVMGSNRWREADRWPIPGLSAETLYLAPSRRLRGGRPPVRRSSSSFTSNPATPLVDPYADRSGAHDYRALAARPDVLMFETPPLESDIEVIGAMEAIIHVSTDARDTDLWVKVMDVGPDGTTYNLMSPGLDVVRASYRDSTARSLLASGRVYALRLSNLLTANTFKKGHRIRVYLSTTFFPHFSRNLHTGELETVSARMRTARVTVHHDARYPSMIILPVATPHERLSSHNDSTARP